MKNSDLGQKGPFGLFFQIDRSPSVIIARAGTHSLEAETMDKCWLLAHSLARAFYKAQDQLPRE